MRAANARHLETRGSLNGHGPGVGPDSQSLQVYPGASEPRLRLNYRRLRLANNPPSTSTVPIPGAGTTTTLSRYDVAVGVVPPKFTKVNRLIMSWAPERKPRLSPTSSSVPPCGP